MRTYCFGFALNVLRYGMRVRRVGWNGKGMWIKLAEGVPFVMAEPLAAGAWGPGTPVSPEPGAFAHILRFPEILVMYTAQGAIVPWTPSQTDILAEDWEDAQ